MTITPAAFNSQNFTGTGTVAVTIDNSVAAADSIIIGVAWEHDAAVATIDPVGISDDSGTPQVAEVLHSFVNTSTIARIAALWIVRNANAASTTFTLDWTGKTRPNRNGTVYWQLVTHTGTLAIDNAGAAHAGGNGSGTNTSGGVAVTTTTDGAYLWDVLTCTADTANPNPTGLATIEYLEIDTGIGADNIVSAISVRDASTAGSGKANDYTFPATTVWAQALVALVEAVADEAVGSSTGTASVAGVGAAEVESVGSSAGVATVTGLGDADGSATGSASGSAAVVGVGAAEVEAVGSSAGVATVSGIAPSIALLNDFDGASLNLSLSSVVGEGDSAVITIYPRPIESEVVTGTRWWTFRAKVTGVNGFRPTFVLDQYKTGGAGEYWPPSWHTTRRIWFSYDQVTWTQFSAAPTVGASTVTYRHGSAFTGDTVFVAYTQPMMPSQVATWIAGLESANPTLISPTPSANSSFVADTFSPQTDELGNTVPAQDFLAFRIMDSSLSPPAGQVKRTMVLTTMVHAAEDVADWVYRYAVEFLLSADAVAQNLRANFNIYCYPTMNPVGRIGGHWRGSWENGGSGEDDLNRHFSDEPAPIEIVSIPRGVMLSDLPDRIAVGIDFHGQWTGNYGYFNQPGDLVNDAFIAALDTYVGTLVDLGNSNSGSVGSWFRNTLNADLGFTVETSEQTPLDDATRVTWAEGIMGAVNDLVVAGDIPPIFDSAVGSSDGVAVVTGLGAADVEATGDAEGVATVTGLAESEVGSQGSSDGQATVSGEAAAETGSVGDAAGVAAVDGQAASEAGSVGESEGSAAVAGESGAEVGSVGSSAGSSTVTGLSEVGSSVGSAAGTSSVTGLAESETEAVGSAAGLATVLGESDFDTGTVGQAAGTSVVSGVSGAEKGSVGVAAGVAVVSGLGDFVGSEPIVKWPVQRSVTIVDQRHTVEIVA